jgi:hypothetical protein
MFYHLGRKMKINIDLDNCGISVITYIDGTIDYADYMLSSLMKHAKDFSKIEFIALVRNSYETDIHHSLYPDIWKNVELDNLNIANTRGSMIHGMVLNEINNIKDILQDIIIIIDADVYIAYKNWDEVIRNELKKQCCIGFNRPYDNFPSVFFFAFKKPILDIKELDFTPDLDKDDSPKKFKIIKPEEAKYRYKNIGDFIKCDTGWQLPMLFKGCGIGLPCISSVSSKIKMVHNKDSWKFCYKNIFHMAEWHYKDKLFGTHKQACRNHRLNNDIGKLWIWRIKQYEGVV